MSTDEDEKDRELAGNLFGRFLDKDDGRKTKETPGPNNPSKTMEEAGRKPPQIPVDQPGERLSSERLEELAQLVADVVLAQRDRVEYEKAGKKLN